MAITDKFFGALGALGQGPLTPDPAAARQAAMNAQQSNMMQQLAAQQVVGGSGGTRSWSENHMVYADPVRMTLAFREVEGGYLAVYALHQGEIYKEVICPTLEDVSKLVFRMAAEKAMR